MFIVKPTKDPCVKCAHWERTTYSEGISISEFGSCNSDRVINATKDIDKQDLFAPGSLICVGAPDSKTLLRTHEQFSCNNYEFIDGDNDKNVLKCVTHYPKLFEESITKRELLNGVMYKYLNATKNRAVVHIQDTTTIELNVLKEDCTDKEFELVSEIFSTLRKIAEVPGDMYRQGISLTYAVKQSGAPVYTFDIYELYVMETYFLHHHDGPRISIKLEGRFGGCSR